MVSKNQFLKRHFIEQQIVQLLHFFVSQIQITKIFIVKFAKQTPCIFSIRLKLNMQGIFLLKFH